MACGMQQHSWTRVCAFCTFCIFCTSCLAHMYICVRVRMYHPPASRHQNPFTDFHTALSGTMVHDTILHFFSSSYFWLFLCFALCTLAGVNVLPKYSLFCVSPRKEADGGLWWISLRSVTGNAAGSPNLHLITSPCQTPPPERQPEMKGLLEMPLEEEEERCKKSQMPHELPNVCHTDSHLRKQTCDMQYQKENRKDLALKAVLRKGIQKRFLEDSCNSWQSIVCSFGRV